MSGSRTRVQTALAPLVGRRLLRADRAADMRMFTFGRVADEETDVDSHDELALHVQCPWRVEGPNGIVTGRADLWESAEGGKDIDWDAWDYDKDPNLQDRRMKELLETDNSGTGAAPNHTASLIVESVDADDFGGARVSLSGGYRLALFPSGSTGEDWRLFQPSSRGHFVVSGGRVETSADPPTDGADLTRTGRTG
jgi:hypothetical protein